MALVRRVDNKAVRYALLQHLGNFVANLEPPTRLQWLAAFPPALSAFIPRYLLGTLLPAEIDFTVATFDDVAQSPEQVKSLSSLLNRYFGLVVTLGQTSLDPTYVRSSSFSRLISSFTTKHVLFLSMPLDS